MAVMTDLPLMLRMTDVREILGVSKPIAYGLVKHPDFPALRFGKAIRVPRDRFFAWFEMWEREQAQSREG
jgi:predicted DNA-binding transcriptional regulator AlpA